MINLNHGRFLLSFHPWLTHRIVMPIAREHRWLYPIDWRELSAVIRFGRAKGRCEHCRRPHGRDVLHLGNGVWWDEDASRWRDGRGRGVRLLPAPDDLSRAQPGFVGIAPPSQFRVTRVVLATAHLNHDPGDNRPCNLAALCQRCHMRHDASEHRRRRWLNAFRIRAIGDLFA
jgi:hypothetical protein